MMGNLFCPVLRKPILVSDSALPIDGKYFICECGGLLYYGGFHVPPEPLVDEVKSMIYTRCVSCGKVTSRCILGEYVCYDCAPSYHIGFCKVCLSQRVCDVNGFCFECGGFVGQS